MGELSQAMNGRGGRIEDHEEKGKADTSHWLESRRRSGGDQMEVYEARRVIDTNGDASCGQRKGAQGLALSGRNPLKN